MSDDDHEGYSLLVALFAFPSGFYIAPKLAITFGAHKIWMIPIFFIYLFVVMIVLMLARPLVVKVAIISFSAITIPFGFLELIYEITRDLLSRDVYRNRYKYIEYLNDQKRDFEEYQEILDRAAQDGFGHRDISNAPPQGDSALESRHSYRFAHYRKTGKLFYFKHL